MATRQLFVMDSRSLDDLHTLATRLGINYSRVVRDALHMAAERLQQVDRPDAQLQDLEKEPMPLQTLEGEAND